MDKAMADLHAYYDDLETKIHEVNGLLEKGRNESGIWNGFWADVESNYGGMQKIWFTSEESFENFISRPNVKYGKKCNV